MPFLFLYAYGDRFHPCYRAEAFYKRARGFQRPKSPKPANLFRRNFYGHNVYKSGGRFYRTGRTPGKKSPRFSPFTEGETRLLSAASGAKSVWHKYFFPPRGFSHDFGKCFFKMSEIDSSVCYTVTENRQKALRRDNARRTARPRPCSCRQSLKINLLRGEV